MFIDFKAVKAAVSIEDVANMLKLTLKVSYLVSRQRQ
jgi:hypothetical protein